MKLFRGFREFDASGTLLVGGHAVFHCRVLLWGGENLQKKTEVEMYEPESLNESSERHLPIAVPN